MIKTPSANLSFAARVRRGEITRAEKVVIFIATCLLMIASGALLWKLTGSLWVIAILVSFFFGSSMALTRLVSPLTREEQAVATKKGETKDLRSIVSIMDKISRLESQGGNNEEIWRLHRRLAGLFGFAFTRGWAMFDKITDGDFALLARSREELIWAKDHADNDKDRQWAEKNLERQRRDIAKWRARAAEIRTDPALRQKVHRTYAVIIKKHYPSSEFDPEDYLRRLNKVFPD